MVFTRVQNDQADRLVTSIAPAGPLTNSIVFGKSQESTSRLWLCLSPLPFVATWLAIVSLHVLCGVSLIVTGRIYVFMTDSNMVYWAKYFGGSANPYFQISSIALTAVGVLHLQQVFWILLASLRERELVFRRRSKRTTSSRLDSMRTRVRSVIESKKILREIYKTAGLLTLSGLKVIGRRGFLGVESKFFPAVFAIREIIEVASQTYQANRSCNLIPRPWINHIMMMLLITNCWSTPILQHFVQGHPALERIACLMMDALLNIGSSFIIPLTIFLPYYRVFDFVIYSFPYKYAYDALWYARLVTENRMLFALSFPDLFSKLVNHISIYSSIVSATTLIQRRPMDIHVTSFVNVGTVTSIMAWDPAKKPSGPVSKRPRPNSMDPRHRIVHGVFYLWGFILLIIYSRAVHRGSKTMLDCRDSMAPWFATKYPCSVFVFNCYRRQLESPVGNELAQLDKETLVFLIYSHCPAIDVPTEIQNFPNMLGFQLHNCSIRSWPLESAISVEKHRRLIAVLLTRTNMTKFPEGLMGPLPPTVSDVEFAITNLTKIPDDLGRRWHSLSLLVFEFSGLKEIPASVFQIPAIVLSFVGNQIRYLPPLDDVHAFYYIVDLGYNPLQALPATSGLYSYMMNVEASNITSLSPWIYSNVFLPFGRGSPYCLDLTSSTPYMVGVGCMVPDPRGGGRVPVYIIDSKITL